MPRLHALIPLSQCMQCRADAIAAGTRRPSPRRRLPACRRRRPGALFKRAPPHCFTSADCSPPLDASHTHTSPWLRQPRPLAGRRNLRSCRLNALLQGARAARRGPMSDRGIWCAHACIRPLPPGAITLIPRADQLTEGMPSSVMAAVTWAVSASMCSAVVPLPTVQAAGSGPLYCPPPHAAASQSSCGHGVEQWLVCCYPCTASAPAVMPRSATHKTHHVLASSGVACARLWQEALDAPVCRGPLQRCFHNGSHGVLAAQRGQQGAAGGHGLRGAGDGWAGQVLWLERVGMWVAAAPAATCRTKAGKLH